MPRRPDPVTRYANQVIKGKIVACSLVHRACERHLEDLETGKARGLKFDLVAANRAIDFFPAVLRHGKAEWAGKPVELELWQKFRIGSIFGWKRADGFRRFRTVYNSLARKQGKSTEASGVAIYMLTADGEAGADVRSYATKKEQACIVFDEAKNMVMKSPALSRRLTISKYNLAMLETASKFEPLSSDWKSQDGLHPSCAIGDEIHAHRTREMYDVVESAMGARRQPLHFMITTRGSSQDGICGEVDDYSQKVLDGSIADDSWFAFIACLDQGDEWDDPKVWIKANPNLGVSVKQDRLEELALKARHAPSAQGEFKRKHCNIWTETEVGWLDKKAWMDCAGEFDEEDLHGQACYGGLDLSGSRDLTALELLFPDIDGKTDKVLSFFWLPERDLEERANNDRAPYPVWKERGFLRTTPGAAIDKRFVARDIAAICSMFDVKAIAFDRWRIADLIAELDAIGFDVDRISSADDLKELRYSSGVPMVDWGQGFKDMSPALDEIETSIFSRRFRHGGNPILTWCASNVVVSLDAAGNRKFDKRKSPARIDGIVAAAMAFGVRSRMAEWESENDLGPSPYDSRGFLQL